MNASSPLLKAASHSCLAGLLAALLHCSAGQPDEPRTAPAPEPAARPQQSQIDPWPTFELPPPGRSQQGSLERNQQHLYPLSLEKGDYLHLSIEQIEADVALSLLDPDDKPLFEVNTPDDVQVIESLHLVADRLGRYQILLKPAQPLASGRYRIWIEELRPALQLDRAAWAAFRLMMQAQDQFRRGNSEALQSALQSFRQAAEKWKQAKRGQGQASALKQMAMIFQLQGKKSQEYDHYAQALQLFRDLGDQVQVIDLLDAIGGIHLYRGKLEQAIKAWQEGLRIAERAGDAAGKASLLNSLGLYYRRQGRIDLALVCYGQALELHHALGRKYSEAIARENRGYLHLEAGNYLQALDDLNEALKIFRQLDRPSDQAHALTRLGLVKYQQKEYRPAIQFYKKAIEVRRNLQDEVGNGAVLAHLAAAYGQLNETERAYEYYRLSLESFAGEDHAMTRAAISANLGELFLNAGQPGRAKPYLIQAADLYSDSQAPGVQAHVKFLYAKAERSFGRLAAAKDLAEVVLDAIEEVRRNSPGRSLRAAFWASRFDYIEFYIDLLMQMHEEDPSAGYHIQAFEASQSSRARGLYEALSNVGTAKGPLDPDLLERLNALNDQIEDLVQRSASSPEDGDSVESRLRRLLLQRDLLQVGYDDSAASLPDPELIRLRRLQNELLDKGTLLLAFALGEKRSFLWAVGSDSFSSHVLPSRQLIERHAQDLYGYLARSHSSLVKKRLQASSLSLGELLLRDVSAKLGGKRLLIAPDGILHIIPFNVLALDRGADPPRPLIADHEIVNLPSVPILGLLRRNRAARPAAPKAVAVWADPVFSPSDDRVQNRNANQANQPIASQIPSTVRAHLLREGSGHSELRDLERLPASRQEAKAILSLVSKDQSFKAFDFAASRESVLSASLDQFRMLHFATHGLLYPNLSGASGIVLSLVDRQGQKQDGFLPAYEIYNLKLNADLVVVSACKSALGKRVRGEGIGGLTHGFLYAGASRVVVSLWNVHDYANSLLMEKFYSNLLQAKMKPAEALRQAQMEMREFKHWKRPYFWAGFVLQGEWN